MDDYDPIDDLMNLFDELVGDNIDEWNEVVSAPYCGGSDGDEMIGIIGDPVVMDEPNGCED